MIQLDGIIIKSISGFYYVEAAGVVYECKAKGSMRNTGITPVTGDYVRIEVSAEGKGTVAEVYERKSVLQRPPVANIELLFIVISTCEPEPNFFVSDKLTAIAVSRNIEPVIVITKTDLAKPDSILRHYVNSTFDVIVTGFSSEESVLPVADRIKDKICAISGNSGVGKSMLINRLAPSLLIDTGEISKKLGRGKHTTRTVELYPICSGRIADTPGFSSLEYEADEPIMKDELPFCFPEFLPFLGKCKFSTCTHTVDKGCEIIKAVNNGLISAGRHESYKKMYEEVRDLREWNVNNNS